MNKQFLKNLTILFVHKKMFMFFLLFSKSFPNDRINDIRARKLDFSLSLSLSDVTQKKKQVATQNSMRCSISDGSKES